MEFHHHQRYDDGRESLCIYVLIMIIHIIIIVVLLKKFFTKNLFLVVFLTSADKCTRIKPSWHQYIRDDVGTQVVIRAPRSVSVRDKHATGVIRRQR